MNSKNHFCRIKRRLHGLRSRFNSPLVAICLMAIIGAGLQLGCAHQAESALPGYTTIHFGGAASRSMQKMNALALMDGLESPGSLISAATTSLDTKRDSGGPYRTKRRTMVFAQLLGGGYGAIFVPNNTGGGQISWTLPNGVYNFSALGYDGTSGWTIGGSQGPYCGLALGDSGNRGDSIVLWGTNKTVDILMGPTPLGGSGATQGSLSAPTCGMTPS